MQDYASRIVKKGLSLGCQDVVADVYETQHFQIRFSQNQVDITNSWREQAASVFCVHDKRVVATDIRNLDKADQAVENIVKIAKSSQQNKEYGGIAKGPFKYKPISVDKRIVSLEGGSDFVYAAVNAALAEGSKETAGTFLRTSETHNLATSNGVEAKDQRAGLYMSIRALVTAEASGHGIECATHLPRFKPENAGKKAGQIAVMAKDPKLGEAGNFDVIFEPLFLGSMTSQVGSRASAFTVLAGLSPFGKKIGKPVASKIVSIYDDATMDGRGGKRFDAEGVPTRRTPIVQNGILKTYLHNTSTAKLFKTKTTANAGLVAPDPHQLALKPGDWKKDELFEECRDGIYVTNTWYTRYQNYTTGDFSTIPRDGIFRVKKGEIVESWKGVRLTDNLIHLWKNMKALSKEAQEVEWWGEVALPSFVPYGLATKIGITKSAE